MKQSTAAMLALGAGIAIGAAVRGSGSPALVGAAHFVQPLGTLWLNALKMTLVPLVFAMVANGMIALDRSGGGGRLLGIAVPLLVGLLVIAMAIGMAFGLVFVALWPPVPGALASIGAAAPPPDHLPSLLDMIVGLVPSNPIAAASNGAMASIVVFAVIFGFAVSRSGGGDQPIAQAVRGLADAMIRIVHWVLWFTPLGIFILALGLALDTGLAIAGIVAQMVIASIAGALIAIMVAYGLAWIGAGVSPRRFGPAVLEVQAMAAGTCSSAATLPAMIEASAQRLGVPDAIGGAVLPLAVSIFRFAVPLYQGAVIIILAHALGLTLTPGQALLCGAIFVLAQIGSAGLPGAAVMYASWAPGLQFLGMPIEIVPLLIAGNALPDIVVTVGNVTADMAVTTIVARVFRRSGPALAPAAIAA